MGEKHDETAEGRRNDDGSGVVHEAFQEVFDEGGVHDQVQMSLLLLDKGSEKTKGLETSIGSKQIVING